MSRPRCPILSNQGVKPLERWHNLVCQPPRIVLLKLPPSLPPLPYTRMEVFHAAGSCFFSIHNQDSISFAPFHEGTRRTVGLHKSDSTCKPGHDRRSQLSLSPLCFQLYRFPFDAIHR